MTYLFPLLCSLAWAASEASAMTVNTSEVSGYSKLRSWGNSTLYRIETDEDSSYETNPLLLHLVGSRYDMGYAYGYLLSEEISHAYSSLITWLIGGNSLKDQELMVLLGLALDWQWRDYLSKELPVIYHRELEGVRDGAAAQGCAECGAYVNRAITLANAPGDVQDFSLILIREFSKKNGQFYPDVLKKMEKIFLRFPRNRMHCSMFAVWGKRTSGGELYSARNLDWNKDTGINKNKLVMITVPDDGTIPSASLGFVGLYGPLAGMSAAGLTLHEANLEEEQISFEGFPWVLRLRFIMEFAADIVTAQQLWNATNNTVGFNHMIASAKDAILYRQGETKTVALALETMYQYTAYFADNDTREASATYTPRNVTPLDIRIGYPLSEAVWRTNHGYDPVIRQNYEWSQSPQTYSMVRYMIIHNALKDYETSNMLIGPTEALNITALVGDKGSKHPYQCQDNTDGSNVLSVTFQPEHQTLYAAWERSSGDKWRPAVCSTYIRLNMTQWFTPTPSLK